MSVTLTQYPIEWSNSPGPDQKSIFEWKLGSSIFKGCFKSLSIGDTHVGLGPQPGKFLGLTSQSETINIYFKDTVRIKKESGI